MKNQTFLRAMHCLSHPISIGAVLVLLLNDHVLRRLWPSWWTGKLGDVAWLMFAPFVAAAIMAWLIPPCLKHQEKVVGRLAFTSTGLWFALAKTLPAFHSLTVRLFEMLTRWKVSLLLDPSDLMALPALLIGLYVWEHGKAQPLARPCRGWAMLSLAALATVANSAPPDEGIVCLVQQSSRLIASSNYYSTFFSEDGGFTWQESAAYRDARSECQRHEQAWQVSDVASHIQYLVKPGVGVERSEDNGQTWKHEIDLAKHEATEAYYARSRMNSWASTGPLDALIDTSTGHLVVAMGHDGVLIRTADGRWHQVAVGLYRHEELNRIDRLWTLLSGEFWLGLLLLLLFAGTLGMRMGRNRPAHLVLAVLAWLCWGVGVVSLPALTSGYTVILLSAIPACALFALPWGLNGAWQLYHLSPQVMMQAGVAAVFGMLVFLLPYVLWSQGLIQQYQVALIFALSLVVTVLFVGDQYLRRFLTVIRTSGAESSS